MTIHTRPGDIAELDRQVTALGGELPTALKDVVAAITAVNSWTVPESTDIAAIARRGELTATNAAQALTAALNQPTINGADLKVNAKAALAQRFAAVVAGGAGDAVITSIRPAFTTACTAIAEAAEIVDPTATVDDLAEASDEFIAAWRTLAEHRGALDQVLGVIDLLTDRFDVLGNTMPWHTPRALDAAFLTPDVGRIELVGRALFAGTRARAGRWHAISSAIQLNTVTEARSILTTAEAEYQQAQAREYAATHGTLTAPH